ncbi:hypothetical protein C8Q74DRAFT_1215052 [Fomes fomentarius]|nr:hypothetical protein C8Q74DRAFT_1215052 [Fomes fomentarius]
MMVFKLYEVDNNGNMMITMIRKMYYVICLGLLGPKYLLLVKSEVGYLGPSSPQAYDISLMTQAPPPLVQPKAHPVPLSSASTALSTPPLSLDLHAADNNTLGSRALCEDIRQQNSEPDSPHDIGSLVSICHPFQPTWCTTCLSQLLVGTSESSEAAGMSAMSNTVTTSLSLATKESLPGMPSTQGSRKGKAHASKNPANVIASYQVDVISNQNFFLKEKIDENPKLSLVDFKEAWNQILDEKLQELKQSCAAAWKLRKSVAYPSTCINRNSQ